MKTKTILGLDLGTNSIGWSLIEHNFEKKEGNVLGLGSRIIPMSQEILGKFDAGQSHSQTADRTGYRSTRKLIQRNILRRERLHRVLNILGFLPEHYANSIDFEKHYGQFKKGTEPKVNYRKTENGKYEFIFKDSFMEMLEEFQQIHSDIKIPYDWTVYYLRKKALSQKISKEELAWLILNFNQKRGYYQLRGEEEEVQTKVEEFYTLKVDKVEETEDKNARGTWYNVVLENGWIYRRQSKDSLADWKGKIKEFIVTTQLEKDGSPKKDKEGAVKRSFRAVDSEKDWIAIKKKTEQDINKSENTVGEYIYASLIIDPTQKIRGKLIKTIERKYYKEEFERIIKTQIKYHPELDFTSSVGKAMYKKCIEELYPRNEAHQNNIKERDFEYLFKDDIIFYQRPLKTKKSTISNCPYEYHKYKTKDKEGKIIWKTQFIKCISKSNPLFQEFRLWQFLRNLKIYEKEKDINGKIQIDVDVTKELFPSDKDWVALFDFLNDRKEIDQKQLIAYFVKQKLIPTANKANYRWNHVEDRKYTANDTRASIVTRLGKVKNVNPQTFLTKEIEQQLWHIIYSVKDRKEFEKALETFADKHLIDNESFVDNFKKIPPYKNEYGAYSEKAIKKLLSLMRIGNYWDENEILENAKDRIALIMERVNTLNTEDEKKLKEAIREISDDEIPQQFIQSFVKLKDTSALEGLNTFQACYAVYGRHSEIGNITQWKTPEAITKYLEDFKRHSLRNPIVEQVVTETLRVVKDIWMHFGNGNPDFFNEIHVELGREMKSDKKTRERIHSSNLENENTNQRIKAILEELRNETGEDIRPFSPSHQEILKIYEEGVYQNPDVVYKNLKEEDVTKIRRSSSPTKSEINKYKLWLEQGYISPYTGKIIPLSKLFSADYQIEHIIPQSRYFDNSLSNKVICESEVNQVKDNQTGLEFIKNNENRIIDLGNGKQVKVFKISEYESHCNQYFKKNRTKLKNLLSEDIPEGFINRQLNDSRHISKLVKNLLSNVVREDGEKEVTSKNLVPVTGKITSKLKQDWGLNDKWNELISSRFKRLNELTGTADFGYWDEKINAFRCQVPDVISRNFSKKRIDHRHHALDALVVACCTRNHTNYLASLNTQKENYGLREKLLIVNKEGHFTKHFQMPWDNFCVETKNQLEKTVVSFKQNLRVINKTNNKTWQWETKDGKNKKVLKKQIKGQNWAIRKPLHEDTYYGKFTNKEGKERLSLKVSLDTSFNEKKIENIKCNSIKKLLLNHLKQECYQNQTDSSGKVVPAYELAFSEDGIKAMNENIQTLNNGKKHSPIYKVKLSYEKGKKFSIKTILGKETKYAKAATGTNLYFGIYENEVGERKYSIPTFEDLIEIQKQEATIPFKEKKHIPESLIDKKGEIYHLNFYLQPNDLVFVPTEEERNNTSLVDFNNLSTEQTQRIYKFTDGSGTTANFIPYSIAKTILNISKIENSKYNLNYTVVNEIGLGSAGKNKHQKSMDDIMIKEFCWKLKTDRLGNISINNSTISK